MVREDSETANRIVPAQEQTTDAQLVPMDTDAADGQNCCLDSEVVSDTGADDGESPDVIDPDTAPISDGLDLELCQRSCEVVAVIPCGDRRSNCVEDCQSALARNPCAAQTRALMECTIKGGASVFVCSEAWNITTVLPGNCEEEIDAGRVCRNGGAAAY